MLGSSLRSFCTPIKIYLTDMELFQSSSSLRMLRQTVPEGYMLGWGRTGLNWPILDKCTFGRSEREVVGEVHHYFIISLFPGRLI